MQETVHEVVVPSEREQVYFVFHDTVASDNIPPHWHRSIEIDCMLSWPPSDVFSGGRQYRMQTGRLWMANPEDTHYVHTLANDPPRRAVSILYPLHYVRGLYPDIDRGRFEINDIDALTDEQRSIIRDDLFPLFARAADLMEQASDPLRYIELATIQLEVLHTLIRHFFVPNRLGTLDAELENVERVHAIVDYVEAHYTEDVRLEDLCEVCHLSRGYMARFVKAHLGHTVGGYVGLVRAEHARSDLVSGRGNQSEVAALNGYSGLRTMNRQFEEYFGKTAKELLADMSKNERPYAHKG